MQTSPQRSEIEVIGMMVIKAMMEEQIQDMLWDVANESMDDLFKWRKEEIARIK